MTSSAICQNIYCIAHLKLTDQRYQWQCEFNSAIFQSLHFQVNQVSQILARMKGWRFQIILVGGKNVYGPGLWPICPFSSDVLSLLINYLSVVLLWYSSSYLTIYCWMIWVRRRDVTMQQFLLFSCFDTYHTTLQTTMHAQSLGKTDKYKNKQDITSCIIWPS